MAEISNKTLAVLLVVAILISVGGAMLTITQVTNLVNLIPALQGITGLGSTGRVNVSVLTLASFDVKRPNLDFGVGYVTSPYTYAIVESNGSSSGSPAGYWTVSGTSWAAQDMQILNTGTVEINITVQSDLIGSTMIGGTSPFLRFNATDNQTGGSCAGIGTGSSSFYNETLIAAAATKYGVCDNLSYVDNSDSLNISFQVKIPQDAVAGNKTALITFVAVQSPGAA